jgi:hypothetical protein
MSNPNHTMAHRPLRGGIEVCNPVLNDAGTIACIASDAGGGNGLWIVSCYHVLVGSPGRAPIHGEPILQDVAMAAVAGVDAARCDANLDCAAAELLPGFGAINEILGIGILGPPVVPAVGMRVLKSGAATGVTEGEIVNIVGDVVEINAPAGFNAAYEIAQHGDSGSLWVTRDTREPVAMSLKLINNNSQQVRARDFQTVLTALNLAAL